MISIENWKKGFIVSIAGLRLVWHREGRPAVLVHTSRGWKRPGTFRARMVSDSSSQFEFASGLAVREEFRNGILTLTLDAPGSVCDQVRLVVGDLEHAQWAGMGPRPRHEVGNHPVFEPGRRATAFSLDGRWIDVIAQGGCRFGFDPGRITCEAALPAVLRFGFSRNPRSACRLWKDSGMEHFEIAPLDMQWAPGAQFDAKDALGYLGSLSFSGAPPEAFGMLNAQLARTAELAQSALDPWLGFKLADLFLCLPDAALPQSLAQMPGAFLPDHLPGAVRLKARQAKIHAGLARYWQYCLDIHEREGLPVVCHPALLYPETRAFRTRDDMLMAGTDLLFGIDLRSRENRMSIDLPEGEWVHLWTSRRYPPGRWTVYAPPGMPALFYRAESECSWLFDSVRQMASRL